MEIHELQQLKSIIHAKKEDKNNLQIEIDSLTYKLKSNCKHPKEYIKIHKLPPIQFNDSYQENTICTLCNATLNQKNIRNTD